MQEYRIKILDTAYNDLDLMLDVLAQYSVNAALEKYDRIMNHIEKLKNFPLMCEKYHRRPQYRRMVIEDYLVFHKVDEENRLVKIFRVLYAKQDIDKLI